MFLASFGLKPWNDEDTEEGKQILEGFVARMKSSSTQIVKRNKLSEVFLFTLAYQPAE